MLARFLSVVVAPAAGPRAAWFVAGRVASGRCAPRACPCWATPVRSMGAEPASDPPSGVKSVSAGQVAAMRYAAARKARAKRQRGEQAAAGAQQPRGEGGGLLRNKFIRYGAPFVAFSLVGYLGLSTFVGGKYERSDARVKKQSERQYMLEEEHRRAMTSLATELESLEIKPIPRPKRDDGDAY